MSAGISACGKETKPKKGGGVQKQCLLPEDQSNTLQGKWSAPPIKIAFHESDFGSDEKQQFTNAVTTWNAFFNASKGSDILSVSSSDATINQTNPQCAGTGTTIADGTVIYKRRSWTRSPSAVAVTTFCTATGTDAIPKMYNAIMEMNYANFWNGGQQPDMESIALHELGHLIGLDHSCNVTRGGINSVACPDPNSSHWLLDTVMFPTVFFDPAGNGEAKHSLTDNDQGRANCLYQ